MQIPSRRGERPTLGPPALATDATAESEPLESKIGKLWLNRIGIFAILIGVSYFIKYAFDNGWIGPTGRVALRILAGIGLVLWSERFRGKGYVAFSYSLKAVGVGTLYLSLWGAFQIYDLVPGWLAFAAMIVVTGFTITLALTQDAEILAAFALIGGFSTPVLLSTGQNHEIVLFSYVCLLDLAILAIVASKPWRRLHSSWQTRDRRLPSAGASSALPFSIQDGSPTTTLRPSVPSQKFLFWCLRLSLPQFPCSRH